MTKKQTYVMIKTAGEYIGMGNFTSEEARRYAINYMQQNGIGVTYAKVEGTIPFVPKLNDEIDEADAIPSSQEMKESHRAIYGE